MERVIFVEILDRRGRVRERVRLAHLPATVGRGYDNDVILSDAFVSPDHCVVREAETGEIVVEDRGSLNGLRSVGDARAVPSLVLSSGDRFRVGQTVLRLVTPGHLVAPAEPLPKNEGGLLDKLRMPRVSIGVVGASVATMLLTEYLDLYESPGWVSALNSVILGLAGLVLWAGVWAFVNRLVAHRFDFLRHVALACLATLALLATRTVSEYSEFAFSSRGLATAVEATGFSAAILALLCAHLAVIPASNRRRRRVWAVFGTALLVGLAALLSYTDSDVVAEVPVTVPLKSIGVDWMPAISTREFLKRTRRVRDWVDEQAENGR